ncbi:MAG: hypothetical protein D6729_08795 [Deltaproteobacteria bacterium]|nr:MAG: hypothetical protein D6729_08795 [Deltaproteobacteria bacterium]
MDRPALIEDERSLRSACERLAARPILACDLETTGLDPHRDTVLLIQLGDGRLQVAVDARKVTDLSPLRQVLERPGLTVFHNAQFDLKFLKGLGLEVRRPQDTMLLEILLAGGRRVGARTLKASCDRRVGVSLDKAERATFVGFEGTLTESQIAYAIDDVIATWHLFLAQVPEIERAGMREVARIEGAAVDAFAELEWRGIYLDRAAWEAVLAEAETARDAARKKLERALLPVVGGDLFGNVHVNYESEEALREVFERLGYPDLPNLTRATLSRLDHPVAAALLEYRKHQQVLSRYGEGFLSHIHPVTGRVHARFRQIGASTGRASCEAPNLQNIQSGDAFRRAFCAPPGRKIVTADYAGAELRIIAEMSGDPVFLETFERGGDLHAIVASQIFHTEVSKTVRPELRARAKAINFGLAYGMGAGGLAAETGLPRAEAERLLETYFRTYPRIRAFFEDLAQTGLERGYAVTLAGRRLYLEESDDPQRRAHLERVAKNMPIQGSSADIVKLAMARATRRMREEGLDAFIVNTVHDELVFEVSEGDAARAAEVLEAEMVAAGQAFLHRVPTVVDVHVGDHWAK